MENRPLTGDRTFEGLVYEWATDIEPQRHFRGITMRDILRLKRRLQLHKVIRGNPIGWVVEKEKVRDAIPIIISIVVSSLKNRTMLNAIDILDDYDDVHKAIEKELGL